MKTINAKTAQEFLGLVLSTAQREPVTIEQDGLPVAVIISPEDYMILEALEEAYWAEHGQDAPSDEAASAFEDSDRLLHSSLIN